MESAIKKSHAHSTANHVSLVGSIRHAQVAIRAINAEAESSNRALDEWADGIESQLQEMEQKLQAVDVQPIEVHPIPCPNDDKKESESLRVASLVATCNDLLKENDELMSRNRHRS